MYVESSMVSSSERARNRSRVLVVEDEPDIAGLIKRTLERAGDLQVDVAMTGESALDRVTELQPDAIVLDLNLPVPDGLEVCRILRTREASATVPIIMLTARTSEVERIRGLDVGADDYVTKPFVLVTPARVRAALRRVKAAATDSGEAGPTAARTSWPISRRLPSPSMVCPFVSHVASSSCFGFSSRIETGL